jgi:light-regulated signal transduction histidine kinase (bacteriophytochrome)
VSDFPLEFGERYSFALRGYLGAPDETGLQTGYELGRNAAFSGVGVLKMVAIHHEILSEVLSSQSNPDGISTMIKRASDFLEEAISPFEMAYRGYKDANRELQRMNEALEESSRHLKEVNKELESFSYSVSHDLRTPLRAIDGFSYIMQTQYADILDNEGKELLRVIRNNTARMSQLIDDLLRFSRLSRNEMRMIPINMDELARDVFEQLRVNLKERNIHLKMGILPVARGDKSLLQEVFVNLLSNAIKFTRTKETAVIEVGCSAGKTENRYFIKDNGVGFDMKYAGKLFGVFQRLHSEEAYEGTGVGLAIVQRIISRHGGRVWAQGEAEKGAVFYFTLPANVPSD